MPRFALEAALFLLPVPFVRFAHNFWILRNLETNKILAELHGLATSRSSGMILPIGITKNHCLRAYHFVYDASILGLEGGEIHRFHLPIHKRQIIAVGDHLTKLWFQAVAAIPRINQLDLTYPSCGFCLPLNKTINSNSIYHTFADLMQVNAWYFNSYRQIGIENSLSKIL